MKHPERLPMVHRLKWTDQERLQKITNPDQPIVQISRPISIGKDVQRGDKLLITHSGVDVVRSIVQVTDKLLFLKR